MLTQFTFTTFKRNVIAWADFYWELHAKGLISNKNQTYFLGAFYEKSGKLKENYSGIKQEEFNK